MFGLGLAQWPTTISSPWHGERAREDGLDDITVESGALLRLVANGLACRNLGLLRLLHVVQSVQSSRNDTVNQAHPKSELGAVMSTMSPRGGSRKVPHPLLDGVSPAKNCCMCSPGTTRPCQSQPDSLGAWWAGAGDDFCAVASVKVLVSATSTLAFTQLSQKVLLTPTPYGCLNPHTRIECKSFQTFQTRSLKTAVRWFGVVARQDQEQVLLTLPQTDNTSSKWSVFPFSTTPSTRWVSRHCSRSRKRASTEGCACARDLNWIASAESCSIVGL